MSSGQFIPIKLEEINAIESFADVENLLITLQQEINDRFEELYADRTGRVLNSTSQVLTFANGNLANVFTLGPGVYFPLTSNKAATIPGFAGGVGGRVVIIKNDSPATWTLPHESTTALPEQRIWTRTGTAVNITAGNGFSLMYDDTVSRWILGAAQL